MTINEIIRSLSIRRPSPNRFSSGSPEKYSIYEILRGDLVCPPPPVGSEKWGSPPPPRLTAALHIRLNDSTVPAMLAEDAVNSSALASSKFSALPRARADDVRALPRRLLVSKQCNLNYITGTKRKH